MRVELEEFFVLPEGEILEGKPGCNGASDQ